MNAGIRFLIVVMLLLAGGLVWSPTRVRAQDGGRPGIHSYDLLFYPVSAEACQQRAEQLADRLKADANVEIYKVGCDREVQQEGSNIRISYIADNPLTITTTNPVRLKDLPNSMYQTAGDCQAGLAEERTAFEQHLGLPVFEAYCHLVPEHKSYPYAARIDAIGTPRDGMRVIDDMELFFSRVLGDTDALATRMTGRLRERGVAAVRSVVGLEDGISEFFIGSRYYAQRALPIKLQDVTYYRSVDHCERDRGDLEAVLENGHVKPLSVFCSADSLMGEARLHFVMVNGDFVWEVAPDSFTGREACLAGKGAVEEAYRNRLGRNVIGSLCIPESRQDNTWALKVFSNP